MHVEKDPSSKMFPWAEFVLPDVDNDFGDAIPQPYNAFSTLKDWDENYSDGDIPLSLLRFCSFDLADDDSSEPLPLPGCSGTGQSPFEFSEPQTTTVYSSSAVEIENYHPRTPSVVPDDDDKFLSSQQSFQPPLPQPRVVSPITSRNIPASSTASIDKKKTSHGGKMRRFRNNQSRSWSDKVEEVKQFADEYGHCCIPHSYPKNQSLAHWAKRQRYQYKLYNSKGGSTVSRRVSQLTVERIQVLEEIGFSWNPQKAAWMVQFGSLVQYAKKHGGKTNVPSNHDKNPRLGIWVKCQRRQYKLWKRGEKSTMNEKREALLESIGFEWQMVTH